MKTIIYFILLSGLFLNCKAQEEPVVFSKEALQDVLLTTEGEAITFQNILDNHKGKTILIDVWASWCGDCLKSLPKVKEEQKKYPNVEFVFLSLDKKIKSWKKGIKKYEISGHHYYLKSGWKGSLGNFLNLDWIPRYMVIDKNQNIKVFYAKDIQTPNIKNALL